MDSINKAFSIFEVFLNHDEDLSIKDISNISGITPGTVHRITSILVKRGYVVQPKIRQKYSLSTVKLVDFAKIVQHKLKIKTVAAPYLRELSQATNEAVAMAHLLGNVAFIITMINLEHMMSFRQESSTLSLYSTGMGKILMAHMSEKELHNYFDTVTLKPRTPNTVTKIADLKKQLKQIHQDGIAFEDEEHELGIRTVAAPVKNWENNVVAAISVFAPSVRLTKDRMQEIAPLVKKYAFEISKAMGYTGSSL